MARRGKLKFNDDGWDQIVEHVINEHGVPRMQRVADACNAYIESDGYKVSTEGDNALRKRDYRATVITADGEAIFDNQNNDRLIQNFNLAGGE